MIYYLNILQSFLLFLIIAKEFKLMGKFNLKKVFALTAMCFASIAGLTGCGKGSNVFKIGYFGQMNDSGDGQIQRNVIDLFVEKWNNEGTLNGAKVERIFYDNTNNGTQDTEMSIKAAQKLISQDNVNVIIPAQLSNIIQATGQIINDAEILDIGLGLSNTWMVQGWDYVYRSALNNDYQVPCMAETFTEMNQKDIALLYQNTDNCLTFRDSFKAAMAKGNINVIAEEMLPAECGTGVTGQCTKVINANPDAIFITAMGGSFGAVIKQLRQLSYEGMIYIGQILTTTEVESIGVEEVNGVSMFSPYIAYSNVEDCTDPFCKDVLQKYYDKYKIVPGSDMIYKTWDAMLLIENAVVAAKSLDPKVIQPVIKTLKFQGCAGTMDFTRGSNECYFGARAWVYTGNGASGGPTLLADWLANTELSSKIKKTK